MILGLGVSDIGIVCTFVLHQDIYELIYCDIVLLASERDTYRGKNEKIGDVCLFVYMYGRT